MASIALSSSIGVSKFRIGFPTLGRAAARFEPVVSVLCGFFDLDYRFWLHCDSRMGGFGEEVWRWDGES